MVRYTAAMSASCLSLRLDLSSFSTGPCAPNLLYRQQKSPTSDQPAEANLLIRLLILLAQILLLCRTTHKGEHRLVLFTLLCSQLREVARARLAIALATFQPSIEIERVCLTELRKLSDSALCASQKHSTRSWICFCR